MDIIERLRFDSMRCEIQFSKGVARNIAEAAIEIERLRAAAEAVVKDYPVAAGTVRLPGDEAESGYGSIKALRLILEQIGR
jgi:hypothetical protein